MSLTKLQIPIFINKETNISLTIFASNEDSLFQIDKGEAYEMGESPYQLKEGCVYEYSLSEGYQLSESKIISTSKINPSLGRICPNIYVGTLNIEVLDLNRNKVGDVELEVKSSKISYRTDYRLMLEDITRKCTELIVRQSSPVSQYFTLDYTRDSQTLYQSFSFIRSIIDSEEFDNSMHKILTSPCKSWMDNEIEKDTKSLKRLNQSGVKQIVNSSTRSSLPSKHPLRNKIESIPKQIIILSKKETLNTVENQFVKYALNLFLSFCNNLYAIPDIGNKLKTELNLVIIRIEQYLAHSFFKEIGNLHILPYNSPILQRKEGYREIFQVWLMFDLASKLTWKGGDDVYKSGKKDIAILYEYWLFFKILDLLQDFFEIDTRCLDDIIQPTNNKLELQIKQGRYHSIKGIYQGETRKLNVEFSYNKTYIGNREYPSSGSWTAQMRPDYTLSLWPFGISEEEAEREELIVHIHFDAKYKMDELKDVFVSKVDFNEEKLEERRGVYKRGDILKMHSYKDAIRRTAGAYILYPGSESKRIIGFHEILPGLGAFSVSPRPQFDDIAELKLFFEDIISHFLNRASQREKISFYTYKTYKTSSDIVKEELPEPLGEKRELIPDETFVLVAYYKNEKHLEWIEKKLLYNTRINTDRGSIRLGPKEVSAKYLLLHTEKELITNKFYSIERRGPRIFLQEELLEKGYPTNPSQPFYLVYGISLVVENEFENFKWDISKLHKFQRGRNSALPFAVSLSELMKVVVR